MAKSLKEQIEAVRRDEERMAEAAKRRADNVNRIVTPIAEKAAAAVRAKIEDELKGDLAKAEMIDLSRENLKAAAEAFWAAVAKGQQGAGAAKPARAKGSAPVTAPSSPAVSIEG